MKTRILKTPVLIILFCTWTVLSTAQGFNIGVNVGYGLGAGTRTLGVNSTSTTFENVKGSFGQGLNLGINLNYMFTEHVGADLGFGYLMGREFEFTSNNGGSSGTESEKVKGSMLRILPGVRVTAGENLSISPYGRFGLVIGVAGKLKEKDSWSGSGSSGTREFELSGGTSLGWFGAFGLAFKISDKMKFMTELTLINQTYGPEKLENTSNSDGSQLDHPVTFEDNVSFNSDNISLKPYLPFGSIGLNLGLQMGF